MRPAFTPNPMKNSANSPWLIWSATTRPERNCRERQRAGRRRQHPGRRREQPVPTRQITRKRRRRARLGRDCVPSRQGCCRHGDHLRSRIGMKSRHWRQTRPLFRRASASNAAPAAACARPATACASWTASATGTATIIYTTRNHADNGVTEILKHRFVQRLRPGRAWQLIAVRDELWRARRRRLLLPTVTTTATLSAADRQTRATRQHECRDDARQTNGERQLYTDTGLFLSMSNVSTTRRAPG